MKPLSSVLEELSACASEVPAHVPWADPDENSVEMGPTDSALLQSFNARVPLGELEDLYRCCRSVSLADVHNGYFIHSIEMIERDLEHGAPRQTLGRFHLHIVPFGSDGGGGRFAMEVGSRDVYFLPPDLVREGTYESNQDSFTRCAGSPYEFVRWLLDECRGRTGLSRERR